MGLWCVKDNADHIKHVMNESTVSLVPNELTMLRVTTYICSVLRNTSHKE